jgi:hypothetical protein
LLQTNIHRFSVEWTFGIREILESFKGFDEVVGKDWILRDFKFGGFDGLGKLELDWVFSSRNFLEMVFIWDII